MDNEGLYLKCDELITELRLSGSTAVIVVRDDVVLSNKTVAPGGAIFDYNLDAAKPIKVGDVVYFHVTNLEQDWDIPHGFAMQGARNSELLVMPGATNTLRWEPQKVGVFPFYCTDFCSALHQEMQGYVRVSPKGSKLPISFN